MWRFCPRGVVTLVTILFGQSCCVDRYNKVVDDFIDDFLSDEKSFFL